MVVGSGQCSNKFTVINNSPFNIFSVEDPSWKRKTAV